jgi:hypothetical protein
MVRIAAVAIREQRQEVVRMFFQIDPELNRLEHHQLSLRAAEQWELQRAILDAEERARAERKAVRQARRDRYAHAVKRVLFLAHPYPGHGSLRGL